MHSLWSRRSPGRRDRFALAIGGQALWQPCTRLAHQAHHGNAEAGQVRGGPPRHMGAPLAAQAARECPAPPLSPGSLAPEALKRPLCCVLLREVAHEKLSYFTHCLPRPSELGGCSAFPEANRERSGQARDRAAWARGQTQVSVLRLSLLLIGHPKEFQSASRLMGAQELQQLCSPDSMRQR